MLIMVDLGHPERFYNIIISWNPTSILAWEALFYGLYIVNGPLASPMLTLLLPDQIERTTFVKMLLDKYKLSIRPTHKEFGFNGIRFSVHVFNTENEINYASEVLHKELA